ncbi:hypothetical protein NPIL_510381 [Nephila pilipes]|uniref:Uncharacterized protein n=1 Tax=Nephila pilipes TaxID=299642 RepID=A0A8X6UIG2_NEPPI|nr:hypothetical protein NPIL_510381 [Nephila pilipes]
MVSNEIALHRLGLQIHRPEVRLQTSAFHSKKRPTSNGTTSSTPRSPASVNLSRHRDENRDSNNDRMVNAELSACLI